MMYRGDENEFENSVSDKYQLLEKLGGGIFSTVYKALQTATGQDVAVKILKLTSDETANGKNRQEERFRREMKISAKLYHPNIVNVLDFGQTPSGKLFTVFEYIPGQTLAALIDKEGALTVQRTLAIMIQVLEGLSIAHLHNIIHRDLKPENIMVTVVGNREQAKILDFGISTFAAEANVDFNRVTMTKEFLGTPVYSAPEQLRAKQVTYKSDIYSWGLVFLKCLLGRHPYGESSIADVIEKQLSLMPVPIPAELVENSLGMILRWVLEKESDRRPSNAEQLLARLKSIPEETIKSFQPYVGKYEYSSKPSGAFLEYVGQEIEYSQRCASCRPVSVLCLSLEFIPFGTISDVEVVDGTYRKIRNACVEVVTNLRGVFVGECGGLLLFMFGYSKEHEDDSKLAGSAAMKLAEVIMRFNVKHKHRIDAEIKHRMAIHRGQMLVEPPDDQPVTGYVFWLTRQLAGLAGMGEIVVSEMSAVSIREDMVLDTIQTATPRHLRDMGKLYRIKGRLEMFGRRFSQNRRTDMFGRQNELDMLVSFWKTSLEGEGKTILVQGGAGEGKTRLLTEFLGHVREHGGAYMEIICTPETRYSPLFPLLEFIRLLLLPSNPVSKGEAAMYLANSLKKRGLGTPDNIGLFASWFGTIHPDYPPPACSPQKMTRLLLDAICSLLIAESRSTRSVIVVEDLHWADNATLSLLTELLPMVARNGRLLVMSARTNFLSVWSASTVIVHKLLPLKNDSINNIINAIDQREALSNAVKTKIIRKADGVPLVAEELALAAVEQISQSAEGEDEATPASIQLPGDLKGLLIGKLDRLGTAKKSAQLASVIGREFPYSVLAALSRDEETVLLADLDALVSAGIVHVNYYDGEFFYTFHHSLMRDAAYESIDDPRKREIHSRLTRVLESNHGTFAKSQPDRMATHFACAGEYGKAVEYACLSAEKSLVGSFYLETIDHVRKAMTWAEKLDDPTSMHEARLRLHQLLVPAIIATQGYASPVLLEEVRKAEEYLAHIPESSTLRFPVLWGMIIYCHTRPVYEKLDGLLDEAFKVARSAASDNDLAALLAIKGHRLFSKGDFNSAIEHLNSALQHYSPVSAAYHATRYGHDTKIFSLATLALIHTARGELVQAESEISQALHWGQEMDSAQSTAMAMAYEIGMWHYRNEPGTVAVLAKKLVQYAQAKDTTMWNFVASFLGGWANRSVEDIQEGLTLFTNLGIGQFASYWHFPLAQVHCMNGDFETATAILDRHIKGATELKELFYLPELYRLKAKICRLSSRDRRGDGISFALKAIDLAEATGARLFLLRAYVELSKQMSKKEFQEQKGSKLNRLIAALDVPLPPRELGEAKALFNKSDV